MNKFSEDRQVQPVKFHGYGDSFSTGTAVVVSFDKNARVRRAVRYALILWAIALGGAFIPVAHFLIVPVFGIAGFVILFRTLKTNRTIKAIRGTCPDCGKVQAFEHLGDSEIPREISCAGCMRTLSVREM
ncbi:MAG: hypothetical protein OEY63_08840 [Gemmatimonadota bacterium]|nr:hypothetical protein [Gemmatimonadota bacterium]MDH5805335.1 hypothetical protein [Gemmatimonadota bacterium]